MDTLADEIFDNHITLVAMGKGVPGSIQQIIGLLQCQFQRYSQCQSRVLGRFVRTVGHNFRKQPPIDLRSFIYFGVSPALHIDMPGQHVHKCHVQSIVQLIGDAIIVEREFRKQFLDSLRAKAILML